MKWWYVAAGAGGLFLLTRKASAATPPPAPTAEPAITGDVDADIDAWLDAFEADPDAFVDEADVIVPPDPFALQGPDIEIYATPPITARSAGGSLLTVALLAAAGYAAWRYL